MLRILKSFLLVLTLHFSVASAETFTNLPGISAPSESDIREAAVAFVNTTTSPGLSGATLTVDSANRYSRQWRSSLGFAAEFTIKNHIFNGYWGLALVSGQLDDKLDIIADDGTPVDLDLTRDVLGVRGSFGLSFPISKYFKLRPFLSLGVSDLQNSFFVDGLPITDNSGNTSTLNYFETSALMGSTTGSIDAIFSRWYGDNRLELSYQYNLIYTDALSADNPSLESYAWNRTALFKSRYSGPTNLVTSGRPWRWEVHVNHTNFITHNKASLGYTGLFEVGTGIEWNLNMKPLDWFGWQTVGFSVGVITSNDVEGYSVGLTAR
jgi:hypothetical protein